MNKLLILLMTICSASAASDTVLKACPDKPNCVSSAASGSQHTPAFKLSPDQPLDPQLIMQQLQQLEPRIKLCLNENHIRAEIHSRIFNFIDDLDLIIDHQQGLIHIRSAARTGYYDFGVNRRRIAKLRTRLQQAGIIL